MRVVLFGTGKFYQQYKDWFHEHEVVALLDNAPEKHGRDLDGVRIYRPGEISRFDYDRIFILCANFVPMWEQLRELGVDDAKISSYRGIIGGLDGVVPAGKQPYLDGSAIPVTDKKRIVGITHNFAVSGASVVFFQMLKLLQADGYDIVVVAESDGDNRSLFESTGFPCFVDETLAINDLDHIPWLAQLHPDVVILNTVFVCQLMCQNHLPVPVLWWLHDSEMLYGSNPCQLLLPRTQWPNTKVYAVSEEGRKPFLTRCPEWTVHLLPFGVEDACSKKFFPKPKVSEMTFTFSVIGALDDRKSQKWLFRSIGSLPTAVRQQMRLLVVYQNEEGPQVEEYRKVAQPWPEIEFVGRIPHEDMARFYDSIDALICPSLEESMSAVVIEAMAHGNPAIVTRTCGVAGFLTDGKDSRLIDAGDTEALQSAIQWMVEHRADAAIMGKHARATYEQQFSTEVFHRNVCRMMQDGMETG